MVPTAREVGNGGHPIASFCRVPQYICMRPSFGWQGYVSALQTFDNAQADIPFDVEADDADKNGIRG
jgi:hypothetical protein